MEKKDGFLAVGGQHLARGIPEAICLGSDRPALPRPDSGSWQVSWGSKGPM